MPFWNSLESARLIHTWGQVLAIASLILLVIFEVIAHWSNDEVTAKRFSAFAIGALVLLVVFDIADLVYGHRWENLQQIQSDSKIRDAERRARDAEDALKKIPKPIVLTNLVRTDIKLSKWWGNKATVSKVDGDARNFSLTVIANGDGIKIGPTIEIVYPDSESKSTHAKLCIQTGGSGMTTDIRWDPRSDKMVATYLGLPISGRTYIIACGI